MSTERKMSLPIGSAERKDLPICTGVLDYFPAAIAAVARLSKKGNDKHNPGQPLHWSRGKSQDHADCIPRHLIDRGAIDPDSGEYHEVMLAWRALALLQLAEESRGAPLARGASESNEAPRVNNLGKMLVGTKEDRDRLAEFIDLAVPVRGSGGTNARPDLSENSYGER